MIIKLLQLLRFLVLIIILIFVSISCERDFENIGTELVTNEQFDSNKVTFEVIAYNQNLEKSRTDNLPVNGLGVFKSSKYGTLRASIATQVGIPLVGVDFGENPSIDKVILDIPYNATKEANNDNGTPNFTLNEIYGDETQEFQLKIYRLGTYLNRFDEVDPTQAKKYYSDKVYNKLAELHSSNFKPNKNDTMLLVTRADFFEDDGVTIDIDTIKATDLTPSIKFELDKTFFETNFVNGDEANFESFERFALFFNGLYIEATGNEGSYTQLSFSGANMTIYYSNDILRDETDTDLNDDGDTDDTDVPIRTKQKMTFPLIGVLRNSVYERDYNTAIETNIQSALNTPNTVQGEQDLFIQGNAGSMVIVDAFQGMDLTQIRENNWLINEASIELNINQDLSEEKVPTRLFLCKLDENPINGVYENKQILDIITEGEAVYDGNLQIEVTETGDDVIIRNIKYRFRITDYLSEVLKKDNPISPSKFAIKAFNTTDIPDTANPEDTIVRNFSFEPKGVTIYGNRYQSTDADYDKRVKLEIFYSELN